MKKVFLLAFAAIFATSCVTKKDFIALQADYDSSQQELVDVKANLQ